MNAGEQDFEQLLRQMEAEILALKTAHQRPLGALNFFQDSETFTVPLSESYGTYLADIKVTVTIDTPTVVPPIVQPGWDIPNGFYTVWFSGVTVSADYKTWIYNLTLTSVSAGTATMRAGAISSQPIQSITWEVS